MKITVIIFIRKLIRLKNKMADILFLCLGKFITALNLFVKIQKLPKKVFRCKNRVLKNGNIRYRMMFCGIKLKHTARLKDARWDFGKKVIKLNKKSKQYKLDKKLAVFIVTANRPREIDQYLYSLGRTLYDLQIDCYILDSSDDNSTKEVVEKWVNYYSKNNKEQCIFYDRYDEEPVGDSLDKKVIYVFKKYRYKYEYIWPVRDRSGIIFDNCIEELYDVINNKKPDFIVLYNRAFDNRDNADTIYNDAGKLFKDNFNVMTTLHHWILKASFASKIIDKIPLDETNYSLYFPISIFQYIYNNTFSAYVLVKNYIFKYTPTVVRASHWHKIFFKQWFEYFYKCMVNLPNEYKPFIPHVLREWNKRYQLCSNYHLAMIYVRLGFDIADIEKYKKGINYISLTPIETYYKIAKSKIDNNKTEIDNIKEIYEQIKTYKKNKKIGIIE